jgi:hypothetical protein
MGTMSMRCVPRWPMGPILVSQSAASCPWIGFHRNEREIYANLQWLLTAAGRPVPPLGNVPNRYFRPQTGVYPRRRLRL